MPTYPDVESTADSAFGTPRPGVARRGDEGGHRRDEQRLADLLVGRGLLTPEDLAVALSRRTDRGYGLPAVLLEQRLVSEEDLASALAATLNIRKIDFAEYPLDTGAARLIGEPIARRHLVTPIGWADAKLMLAMADPTNVIALDDVRAVTSSELEPVVATRSSILAAIARVHRGESQAAHFTAEAASSFAPEPSISAVRELVEDGPIVKLVNLLISKASIERASDIHIEPGEDDLRVRYRIDGVLLEIMRIPKTIQAGIISRLKVMASLNIAERRLPQDGRITTTIDGRSIDLRVATLPTTWGEKIVMRILDKTNALLQLADLGFLPENLERYEKNFRRPYGTILVTGPTGSGKSTTLYATLNQISDPSRNVITVEDPVEYQLNGINQVQVNAKAGLTFAAALRSILRSDPDVVLVGEIRDRETATIAIEAALTGHLVLSTLHTNDAASTPGRLIEMGLEPFLVGSSLDCIVAQRLARRLCERCREPYSPTVAELEVAGWDFERLGNPGDAALYRSKGCPACGGTGYQGRFAIHEVLDVDEEVERIIVERGHTEEIRKAAVAQGMVPMRQVGMIDVVSGRTSIEEILRVVV
ncbi:MAG TPA: ATPase, T2SS/T4P/T4SS family [Acidimicrobiales bacterium]|nr:ATPase, T2SS/T4P/T4SS family [Acidimicrobiales bacterium]